MNGCKNICSVHKRTNVAHFNFETCTFTEKGNAYLTFVLRFH